MEPSEPPCSTICATSDAENQAEGSLPEPSKDAETQTEEFAYIITSQLIKLRTESTSGRMIKFASTRGYHPTKFSLQH